MALTGKAWEEALMHIKQKAPGGAFCFMCINYLYPLE